MVDNNPPNQEKKCVLDENYEPISFLDALAGRSKGIINKTARSYMRSEQLPKGSTKIPLENFKAYFESEYVTPVKENNKMYQKVVVELPEDIRGNNTNRSIYFSIEDVIGDGNCGWYSLAEQGFFDYKRIPEAYLQRLKQIIKNKPSLYKMDYISQHKFLAEKLITMYYCGWENISNSNPPSIKADQDFKALLLFYYQLEGGYLFSAGKGNINNFIIDCTQDFKTLTKEEKSGVENEIKKYFHFVSDNRIFMERSLLHALSYIFRTDIAILPTCGPDNLSRTTDILKKVVVDKFCAHHLFERESEKDEKGRNILDSYAIDELDNYNLRTENQILFREKATVFIAHVFDVYPFDNSLHKCPALEYSKKATEAQHFNILRLLSDEEVDEKQKNCLFVQLYEDKLEGKDTCLTQICKDRLQNGPHTGTISINDILGEPRSENATNPTANVPAKAVSSAQEEDENECWSPSPTHSKLPPLTSCNDGALVVDDVANVEDTPLVPTAEVSTLAAEPNSKKDTNLTTVNYRKPKKSICRKSDVDHSEYFPNESETDTLISDNDVKKYKYVIPRLNNKSFSDITGSRKKKPSGTTRDSLQHSSKDDDKTNDSIRSKSLISLSQEQALNEDIFTEQHIFEYQNLIAKGGRNRSTESNFNKLLFFQNLILDYNLQGNVLKYNDQQKSFQVLHVNDIYEYVQKKFATIRFTNARKEKDEKNKSNDTTLSKDHPLHSRLKFGNVFYTKPEDQDDWFKKVMKAGDKSRSEENLEKFSIEKYMNDECHSMYSVIHPLFEEYELIIYNASHRLAYPANDSERTCVHACSRVKLVIPAPSKSTDWKSFFVIFNSKLVHGGSRAHRETPLSNRHRYNYRLFNYVFQSYQGTRSKLSREVNEDDSNADNSMNVYTRHETIDHITFEICDKYVCPTCQKYKDREITINVEKEYVVRKRRNTKGNSLRPESYVCGDLDENGWEVHVGVSYITNTSRYKFLNMHLHNLLHGPKNEWKQLVNNKGRSYLKLTDLVSVQNIQFVKSRKYFTDVFHEELRSIIRNIRGFFKHETNGNSLLANIGVCQEQTPHRDFVQKKKGNVSRPTNRKRKQDQVQDTSTCRSTRQKKNKRTKA